MTFTREKPDAGNPHVALPLRDGGTGRFDEGEVASAKPRRGSLLYKLKTSCVVAALVGTAFAGNVCTWTGTGGDGKFSTAANWDVAPVSGNGDLLYFPVGTKDAVSALAAENDLEGLSIAAIRTDGHNNSVFTLDGKAITLTGASKAVCPEIPAATVISNYTALVLNAPLNVNRAGGNADMRFYGRQLTVNAKISATNVKELYLWGRLQPASSSYSGVPEKYPSVSLGSTFNAPIEAPDTVLYDRIGNNTGGQTVYFNSAINVKELSIASSTRDTLMHLTDAGNEIGRIRFLGDGLYLDVAEALGPNTVICDTKDGNGWMWNGTVYIKTGTHQTINRLSGNGDYLANPNFANYLNVCAGTSNGSAELEMRGTADASTSFRVRDAVALTWNPTGDFKQTFRDRVSDTKGEIVVKGGTFAVAGTNAFSGVPTVSVCAGAKLEIASTHPDRPAFGALETLLLGAGAECVVGTGANPFTANKVMASLGTGAKFTVASGVDVKLAVLSVDGVRITDGVYTAGADNPWLEGAGSVTVERGSVTSTTTYWMSSGDGDWDVAGNWSDGVPTATSQAVLLGNGDATVRLSDASVLPDKLTVRNVGGTTTVKLPEDERAWNPTALTLNAGGRLEVPTGAKLVSNDGSGTVLVNGGEICIAGGEMVYTNFHGSFTVQGTSVATGRVFLANGVFEYSHKSETDAYRLRLYPFGELCATNGFVLTPAMKYPFYQSGGRIVIGGKAELRNGTAKAIEWMFGAGESVFEGDAVLRMRTEKSRFHLKSYDVTTPARLVFRGNAYVTGSTMEDPTIGSTGGTRSILEFDTAKPNTVQLGYRCNVGCDNLDGEFVMKRGYVFVGYRGLNVGGSVGNLWNKESTASGAHGVLTMSGGALKLADGATTTEGTFAGFRLADGGPAHLARDLKGAYIGQADVSGGVITNEGSTVIGGGRGIGTYVQTGGAFRHRSGTAAFLVGCAGGTGALTLGGGTVDVSGPAYVGGALTNQIAGGLQLDQHYNGNYPVDQHDAIGTLTVTGGTFRCARDLLVGCDGTGTLALSGTNFAFTVDGNLVLSNTTVAAAGEVAGWTTASRLAFALDAAGGVGPIQVAGSVVNTAGTSIRIDLGTYAGKKTKFPLITAAGFTGAAFDQVEFVGEGAEIARLSQGAASLDLLLSHGTVLLFR